MKIDLTNILSAADEEMTVRAEIGMPSFDFPFGVFPIRKKQPFDLCLTNEKNKQLKVSGEVALEVSIPCDRCLEDVAVPFAVSVERRFPLLEGVVLSDDEGAHPFFEEQQLDVDRLIYDEILVNWPMKVLCRDDCKGLCPVCGQNLNQGDCGCDSEVLDPRMARFQDVFQELKEV